MHNKPHTEESKRKMSESHKGIPNEYRRRKTIEKDGIVLYQCGICKEFKPYEDFYKSKRTILGIRPECKKCHSSECIRLRNKENARESNRTYMAKARANDIEKFRKRERDRTRPKDEKYFARREVHKAIRRGDLIKPKYCSECGRETRLTAHHEDYSKPLDVTWLCYRCHGKRHRKS